MKSNIIKILFLFSLYTQSSPIQNRMLRLYLERGRSFLHLENLLLDASKLNKQMELLDVLNHSNLITEHDKKKLSAKIWYSLNLPKRSWDELSTLTSNDDDILKYKALVLFELRDLNSFLATFENTEHNQQYLSNKQVETFIQYSFLKVGRNKAIRLANMYSKHVVSLGVNEGELDRIEFIDIKEIQKKPVSEIVEIMSQSLKSNSKWGSVDLLLSIMRKLKNYPQKYEQLLPIVFEWNQVYSLNLPLINSSWEDLLEIRYFISKQDYSSALNLVNNSYVKGERSELLRHYFYQCLEKLILTKVQISTTKRIILEGFIDLFSDRTIETIKQNNSISILFQFISLDQYNLNSFKKALINTKNLPTSVRDKISEFIINKVNQDSTIQLVDDEVLLILEESIKENDQLDLLKTKYYIGSSNEVQVKKNIDRFMANKKLKLLLTLSTYTFELNKFDVALYITESAYKLSPWNIRVLRRLVTIHHRIGNITKKLEFLEKLNILTFNLLKKDLNIARDEVNLLNHKWDWNTNLPKPKPGNKVIHVLNKSLPEINGYTIRSKEIVHQQKILGYKPEVVTKLGWPQTKSVKEKTLEINGVSYNRLYHSKQDIRLNIVPMSTYFNSYATCFAEFLIKSEPKLVHAASNFQNALPAIMAAKKLGIPTVYEVRGLWQDTTASKIPQFDQSERYNLHQDYEIYCCELADKVVVIGESLAEHLIHLGVDKSKISIVPNGVDVDEFKPQSPNKLLIEKYDLKGKTVFGFIGSVTEYEGLDILLKATRKLKDRNERISLILVGDGPALKGLKDLARQLDLLDIVHFVGRIPHTEVKEYYSIIDAFPFPRKNAKVCALVTPLKPFEVMGMGKIAMVSNIPALNEMVKDKHTGLIFEAESVDSLFNCLINVNEYKHLGVEGRKWVEKERAWNLLINKYDAVYEDLTN